MLSGPCAAEPGAGGVREDALSLAQQRLARPANSSDGHHRGCRHAGRIRESLLPPVRKELLQDILDEAQRVNRLVANLLDMTRLEAGHVTPNREWLPVEELVARPCRDAPRAWQGILCT